MIDACACMGPIKGEPYCPCQMQQMGLRTVKDYEWSEEDKQKFEDALRSLGWK
jgi:hypothetical protein